MTKSTKLITTNVFAAVISAPVTAASLNYDIVDSASLNILRTKIWSPPSTDPYAFNTSSDEESNEDGFFLHQPTYLLWLSIEIVLSTVQRVASLFKTGAAPILVNRSFLPRLCHDYIQPAPSPLLRASIETSSAKLWYHTDLFHNS